jgi:carotenoid cleavage dioxygenase-like enzyme
LGVSNAFDIGFRSQETELIDRTVPVEGEIPDWLSGTLLRNGPGKFEVDDSKLRHWFDGFAMVRAYDFTDGDIEYSNRFLRTESYADALAGRASGQFATDTSGLAKIRSWLGQLGPPAATDNANVHVAEIDGELVAQTEVPRWVTFDPETLNTQGTFEFVDEFEPDMTTAHLVEDPDTGALFGHALSFGRTHEYHLFRIPDGQRRREVVTSIPTDNPAYVHSIGVSKNHLILVETPLQIDILRSLSPFREGFFDLLEWDENGPTTVCVLDRETGDTVARGRTEGFFTFHTVNAYDDDQEVVVDLVAFADPSIVEGLSFEMLEKEGFDGVAQGRLIRLRIGQDGNITTRRLYNGGIELPVVPRAVKTKPYRYAYGQATDRPGANGLVKIDTERGTAREWWERDTYVEEPCVVQRPDAETEDDGVVLAPALDVEAERSKLLLFDCETLELQATAHLPQHEPFGFHGRFFDSFDRASPR